MLANHPLRQVLQKPETLDRLIKWPIELGELYIIYHSQEAIKAQVVDNFLSQFTDIEPPLLPTDHSRRAGRRRYDVTFHFGFYMLMVLQINKDVGLG